MICFGFLRLRHCAVTLIKHKNHSSPTYTRGNVVRTLYIQRQLFANESDDEERKLTPEDVTQILRSNESSTKIRGCHSRHRLAAKYYDFNQLGSNKPMEDARAEAFREDGSELLFGIFDGHAGAKCAQTVASRLFYYIAACLAGPEELEDYKKSRRTLEFILKFLNDDPQPYLGENFSLLLDDLLQRVAPMQPEDALKYSFTRLDDDISNEILRQLDKPYSPQADVSGSVAVVALIKDLDLYVAGAGDCEAVLGTFTEADGWSVKKMNNNHNIKNTEERKRIMSEHPSEKRNDVLEDNRILGVLAPFRAFGDYYCKWDQERVTRYFKHQCPGHVLKCCKTPPYLTALPEVFHHRLTANDKFLILASDGLWERLTPFQAVWLVGDHMRRKNGLEPLELPPQMAKKDIDELNEKEQREMYRRNSKIMELNGMLKTMNERKLDDNAATHLLRYALAHNCDGEYDDESLAWSLAAERRSVRFVRDDITITVIYMNNADFFAESSIVN